MKNLKNLLFKLKWIGLELNLVWEVQDQKLSSRGGEMCKRRKK